MAQERLLLFITLVIFFMVIGFITSVAAKPLKYDETTTKEILKNTKPANKDFARKLKSQAADLKSAKNAVDNAKGADLEFAREIEKTFKHIEMNVSMYL